MSIHERGVRWLGGLDEAAAAFGSQRVEADRDELESLRIELVAQFLPPGQVG